MRRQAVQIQLELQLQLQIALQIQLQLESGCAAGGCHDNKNATIHKKETKKKPNAAVTAQLPLGNERHVAAASLAVGIVEREREVEGKRVRERERVGELKTEEEEGGIQRVGRRSETPKSLANVLLVMGMLITRVSLLQQ